MATKVKVVSIRYSWFGSPNNRKIEKAMQKWLGKGYTLKSREESTPGGCLLWRRAKTHLTFIKEE